jgi:hypothetical protein
MERHSARSHFIEHYAKAEYVAARVKILSPSLLRATCILPYPTQCRGGSAEAHRSPKWACPEGVPLQGSRALRDARKIEFHRRPDRFRQAKIQNFCLPARRDEDVRRFNVPVDNAPFGAPHPVHPLSG